MNHQDTTQKLKGQIERGEAEYARMLRLLQRDGSTQIFERAMNLGAALAAAGTEVQRLESESESGEVA